MLLLRRCYTPIAFNHSIDRPFNPKEEQTQKRPTCAVSAVLLLGIGNHRMDVAASNMRREHRGRYAGGIIYVQCERGSFNELCRAVGARPLRGSGLLVHELLQRVVCLLSPFFQTPAFPADFLLQGAQLVCVGIVESEGAAPEAAVDVGGFVAVDDLRLAG